MHVGMQCYSPCVLWSNETVLNIHYILCKFWTWGWMWLPRYLGNTRDWCKTWCSARSYNAGFIFTVLSPLLCCTVIQLWLWTLLSPCGCPLDSQATTEISLSGTSADKRACRSFVPALISLQNDTSADESNLVLFHVFAKIKTYPTIEYYTYACTMCICIHNISYSLSALLLLCLWN